VLALAGGGVLYLVLGTNTYHGAKSAVTGSEKPYTIPIVEASAPAAPAIKKPAACPTPPVGEAEYRLLYNGKGRAYLNGHRVQRADGAPDWISSYFPDQALAKTGIYHWRLSVYWTTQTKGGGAWAVITDGRNCQLKPLLSTQSSVTYDVDGVKVPATDLSLVLTPGFKLGYVLIAADAQDPRAAN
jgi:hypothetical protein